MIRTSLRILVIAVAALALAVACAQAHTAQVLPRGAAELNLGVNPGTQLIHAVLERPTDVLTVNLVVPKQGRFSIEILVPDQPQERSVQPPVSWTITSIAAGRDAGQTSTSTLDYATVKSRIRTDASTRIRYRQLTRFSTEDGLVPGSPLTIRIARGETPLRVAIRTDTGGKFRLDNPRKVPRTVDRLGAWFTQPAAGAPKVAKSDDDLGDGLRGLVWIPVGFAIVLVLISFWWITRGRRTARVRGVERAQGEQPPR